MGPHRLHLCRDDDPYRAHDVPYAGVEASYELHSRSHRNPWGHLDQSRRPGTSSENKRYVSGNWKTHKMGKTNDLVVADSYLVERASGFRRLCPKLCWKMERLRWLSRSALARSCT